MWSGIRSWILAVPILLPVGIFLLVPEFTFAGGETLVSLKDGGSGRRIGCAVLHDGEPVVLTWMNSLFRLKVTEIYTTREGILEQTAVTYGDPSGKEPPGVEPKDVEDLYHTGGPFTAKGLAIPYHKIVFRIGEIGNPVLNLGGRSIYLADEVGFGGSVILEAGKADPRVHGCP